MNTKYEAVIGLEVHAQLLTDSKIFCGCSTKFGNDPNSNTCPVCLGHPGVLPVLNKKVVEYTALMGLATNCSINEHSIFARKNYFYPDLPKGYQISQYEEPICENGFIEIKPINGSSKKIGITRIHMEEDAGKSIHDQSSDTLVDVNRCGVPLMEIVSEPDMRSAEEAYLYLSKVKQIVQYLGICDGNMEEGSLRCDANISVRLKGERELGVKTEIKNMNSFRNVERAIDYEVKRQIELIEDGERIVQQTLLWDADANEAHPMRSKEEAHDYRYFPDPDLL
ncbi:MAG: Asp-tRNA(Asn)/Glu-tRNA(Gln) amidotransferase subunit GatB, partial [Ignavibacteriales bacterium]